MVNSAMVPYAGVYFAYRVNPPLPTPERLQDLRKDNCQKPHLAPSIILEFD